MGWTGILEKDQLQPNQVHTTIYSIKDWSTIPQQETRRKPTCCQPFSFEASPPKPCNHCTVIHFFKIWIRNTMWNNDYSQLRLNGLAMRRQNFEHVCVFLKLWEHCYPFLGVQLFSSPVHVRVVNAVYWVATRHQGVQKIWWQSVWWSSYSSDNNNEEISHCYPPASMKADIFLFLNDQFGNSIG